MMYVTYITRPGLPTRRLDILADGKQEQLNATSDLVRALEAAGYTWVVVRGGKDVTSWFLPRAALVNGILEIRFESAPVWHEMFQWQIRATFMQNGVALGRLWFEDANGTQGALKLFDYDGVFALPGSIAKMLRDAGYIVGEDFN